MTFSPKIKQHMLHNLISQDVDLAPASILNVLDVVKEVDVIDVLALIILILLRGCSQPTVEMDV